jgi:hypothetical protein
MAIPVRHTGTPYRYAIPVRHTGTPYRYAIRHTPLHDAPIPLPRRHEIISCRRMDTTSCRGWVFSPVDGQRPATKMGLHNPDGERRDDEKCSLIGVFVFANTFNLLVSSLRTLLLRILLFSRVRERLCQSSNKIVSHHAAVTNNRTALGS